MYWPCMAACLTMRHPHVPNAAYTLDFKGRVKEASVKNFQLVMWDHNTDKRSGEVLLQFGKIEDDLYALDFMYPLNVEVAFAVAIPRTRAGSVGREGSQFSEWHGQPWCFRERMRRA